MESNNLNFIILLIVSIAAIIALTSVSHFSVIQDQSDDLIGDAKSSKNPKGKVYPAVQNTASALCGDLNLDGRIDIADELLKRQIENRIITIDKSLYLKKCYAGEKAGGKK